MINFQYRKIITFELNIYIIWYSLPYVELVLSIENSCHLPSDSKYILANVATMLLQRLSQISSAKLSCNAVKTLCVSSGEFLSVVDRWCALYIHVY